MQHSSAQAVNALVGPFGFIDVAANSASRCMVQVNEYSPENPANNQQNSVYVQFLAWGRNRTDVADKRISSCRMGQLNAAFSIPYDTPASLRTLYLQESAAGASVALQCTPAAGWGWLNLTADNRTQYVEWYSSSCFNKQWTLHVPSSNANLAVCTNALNLTCGGMVGTRTIVEYFRVINECPSYVYEKCQRSEFKIDCWTPPCPVPVVDCKVASEYGPWSACEPFQDTCQKRRIKEITVNASNGGIACPSLESRTQVTECTPIECQRIRCNYTTTTVVGNCSAPCGPAQVETTVYNISLTPLTICTQGMQPVISRTYSNCSTNLPCKAGDPITPIDISCYTIGTQGPRNNAISKVVIDLGLTDLFFNGSNTSLASSFRLTHTLSGRPMFLDPNRLNVSQGNSSTIELGLLVSPTDYEPSTGYLLDVLYTPLSGDNGTLLAGGIQLTSFRCVTEDRVPPAILYASAIYEGEDVNGAESHGILVFTEDVVICEDPTESFYGVDFSWSMITGYAGDLLSANDWNNPATFAFSGPVRIFPNSTVNFANAGKACDRAGNPNVEPTAENAVLVEVYENITRFLPEETPDTIKLFSNNETGLVNTVAVFSRVPLDADYLRSNVGLIQVVVAYRNESSGLLVTVKGNGTSIRFENYDNSVGMATQFVLEFDSSAISWSASDNMTLSNFTVIYPTTVQDSVTLPPELIIVTPNITTDYSSTNIPSPRLVSAKAYVGDSVLTVTFDRPKSGGKTFAQQEFVYTGSNRILFVSAQFERTVELQMGASFTYNMVGVDRLTFVDSTPTTQAVASTVLVQNTLGARPLITSAILERSYNAEMWDTLRVVLDSEIGSFSIPPLSGGISFNWTSPLIQSIQVSDYSVSGATIIYKLKPACADSTCFDADTPIFVTIRGINNELGVLMDDFENVRLVDLSAPKPVSAIKLEDEVYFLSFNKPITASSNQLVASISPTPASCQYLPDTTITCYYDQDLCEGDLPTVEFESTTLQDKQQNSRNIQTSVSVQCPKSAGSCNFWDLPWYAGYTTMIFSAIGVLGMSWFAGSWAYQKYRVCRGTRSTELDPPDM